MPLPDALIQFLASVHPYDSLTETSLHALAEKCAAESYEAGATVFSPGDTVEHLYIVAAGEVEIKDETGIQLSILGQRNSFGERALLREEAAVRTALIAQDAELILIPAKTFFALIDTYPSVSKFFDRRRPNRPEKKNLATMQVAQLMTPAPVTCRPETSISQAAAQMRDAHVSSLCVTNQNGFQGIVTLRDINDQVVAEGLDPQGPVSEIMSAETLTLGPSALVTDVLHIMVEQGIGHVPIVDSTLR